MSDTTLCANTRCWESITGCRPYGKAWGCLTHTLAGLEGTVDGKACELRRAMTISQYATHQHAHPRTRWLRGRGS